jgi:hypothetical protein
VVVARGLQDGAVVVAGHQSRTRRFCRFPAYAGA